MGDGEVDFHADPPLEISEAYPARKAKPGETWNAKTRTGADGTIGIDDPLSKYLPTFPNAAHITLRELLNHTSGIEDVFDVTAISSAVLAHPSTPWTADQVLAKVGKLTYFPPGTAYHYSNTDFILLGLVVEKQVGDVSQELNNPDRS